jgi:hypothetical protein
MSDYVFKSKFYGGKWYVHATDTGWLGPYYGSKAEADADCRRRNVAPKRGPDNPSTDTQDYQKYGVPY